MTIPHKASGDSFRFDQCREREALEMLDWKCDRFLRERLDACALGMFSTIRRCAWVSAMFFLCAWYLIVWSTSTEIASQFTPMALA